MKKTLGPSTSLQMIQFHSYLWPHHIPLHIPTTSFLSIYLLLDILVVSMSWLLKCAVMNTEVEMNLFPGQEQRCRHRMNMWTQGGDRGCDELGDEDIDTLPCIK